MNRNFEIETSRSSDLERIAREEMVKANKVKPQEISPDKGRFNDEREKLGLEYVALMDEQTAALVQGEHEKAEQLLIKAEKVLDKIHELEKQKDNKAQRTDILITPEVQKEIDELKKSNNKKLMN